MASKSTDDLFMTEAHTLARAGIALASPNPCVGAIIVDERGRIIGRGTHTYAELKHAEILALEEAGPHARGNTLYINLEPCCHTGRTGSCADALIRAGIARVVASMRDPNPLVAGKGFDRLRAAGIEVTEGVLESEARHLNESFAKYIRTGLPLITLKSAMTLDGKIAPPPSVSHNPTALGADQSHRGYITGEAARANVQQLRHASDAIMVGVGTVIADDPQLTDRSGLPRRRSIQRVILDSRLRIPLESRVVTTCKDDVLVFCSFAEEKKRRALEERGVRVEQVPLAVESATIAEGNTIQFHDGRPDMHAVVARLGALQLTSLLVEGGAMVNWACLQSAIVDKIFFYYTPRILGGTGSVPFALGAGFPNTAESAHIKNIHLHQFGEDFAIEGYLRDPYA